MEVPHGLPPYPGDFPISKTRYDAQTLGPKKSERAKYPFPRSIKVYWSLLPNLRYYALAQAPDRVQTSFHSKPDLRTVLPPSVQHDRVGTNRGSGADGLIPCVYFTIPRGFRPLQQGIGRRLPSISEHGDLQEVRPKTLPSVRSVHYKVRAESDEAAGTTRSRSPQQTRKGLSPSNLHDAPQDGTVDTIDYIVPMPRIPDRSRSSDGAVKQPMLLSCQSRLTTHDLAIKSQFSGVPRSMSHAACFPRTWGRYRV
jgi:hypothetical protein